MARRTSAATRLRRLPTTARPGAFARGQRSASIPTLTRHADRPDDRPFYEIERRPQGAIVRRTTRRYESLTELAPSFRAIHAGLVGVQTDDASLLIDLRAIVGRNDPEFEAALAPLRRALLLSFGRVALLVRTTIGSLQLERYLAADGIAAHVFAREELATAWFLGGSAAPRGEDVGERNG